MRKPGAREDRPDTLHEAIQMGVLHYVIKPFSPRELLRKVRELLEAG